MKLHPFSPFEAQITKKQKPAGSCHPVSKATNYGISELHEGRTTAKKIPENREAGVRPPSLMEGIIQIDVAWIVD